MRDEGGMLNCPRRSRNAWEIILAAIVSWLLVYLLLTAALVLFYG